MSIAAPVYKRSWYHGVIREKDDSSKYTAGHPGSSGEKEPLYLDKIMKRLFKLSDKVTLDLINSLFDESFSSENTTVHYSNSEFINHILDRIVGDIFVTLETEGQSSHYHTEFQTLNDKSMVIRMFQYGFQKAVELAKLDKMQERKIITLPKQVVIFLEKIEAIEDEMSFTLRLPDGTELDYTVPVVKYWTYLTDELMKRKMYALLPLQVFQFRKVMNVIHESRRSDSEKSRLITGQFKQMEQTTRCIMEVLGELVGDDITVQELDGIISSLQNLTSYIYSHYGEYNTFEKVVQHMIDTIIDPRLWEEATKKGKLEGKAEGKEELILAMLQNGLTISRIAEMTGLSVDEVAGVRKP